MTSRPESSPSLSSVGSAQGPAYKEDAPDAGDLDGDEPGEYVDEDDHYWLVTELECAGSVAAGTLWGRAVIASIGVDGGTLR